MYLLHLSTYFLISVKDWLRVSLGLTDSFMFTSEYTFTLMCFRLGLSFILVAWSTISPLTLLGTGDPGIDIDTSQCYNPQSETYFRDTKSRGDTIRTFL